MDEETSKVLRRFTEKSERLRNRGFVKYASENRVGFTHSEKGIEQHIPEPDAIEAAAQIVRMFLQKNEKISFFKIIKQLRECGGVSPECLGWLVHASETIDEFFDRPSKIRLGDHDVTNRELVDTFIYGDFSHTNQADRLEEWRANEKMFPILQSFFVMVMADVLRIVFAIEGVVRSELNGEPIQTPPPPSKSATTRSAPASA